jgi:hypothetical protein
MTRRSSSGSLACIMASDAPCSHIETRSIWKRVNFRKSLESPKNWNPASGRNLSLSFLTAATGRKSLKI